MHYYCPIFCNSYIIFALSVANRTVFTAGSNSGNVTITTSSEGVSGSINITVVKPVSQLQVHPQTATTSVGTPFKFIITGGTAPYIVIVNTTSATVSPTIISQEGKEFSVTSSVAETVIITVIDDQGQTATATLNVI